MKLLPYKEIKGYLLDSIFLLIVAAVALTLLYHEQYDYVVMVIVTAALIQID